MKLICHPRCSNAAVLGVECRIHRDRAKLKLEYSLFGDLSRISLPPPRSARQANNLWRHTCFEAFILPERGPKYIEFNFSPSGEWAAFAFSDYRKSDAWVSPVREPQTMMRRTSERLDLDAVVFLDHFPAVPLNLALSAVVEDHRGGLSYWALKHPRNEPDFHHRDSFVLTI